MWTLLLLLQTGSLLKLNSTTLCFIHRRNGHGSSCSVPKHTLGIHGIYDIQVTCRQRHQTQRQASSLQGILHNYFMNTATENSAKFLQIACRRFSLGKSRRYSHLRGWYQQILGTFAEWVEFFSAMDRFINTTIFSASQDEHYNRAHKKEVHFHSALHL